MGYVDKYQNPTPRLDRMDPLSPNQHAAWVSKQVSESEADVLQHGQERRGLHVGDPDLILVLGQFSVEHGVEDGAADSKDVLTPPKADRQTERQTGRQTVVSYDGSAHTATFITFWLSFFTFPCSLLPCVPALAASHLEVRPQSGRQPSSHC